MYKIHEGSMSIKYQNIIRLILIYSNEINQKLYGGIPWKIHSG